MAKKKWNWKYRQYIGQLSSSELRDRLQWCALNFGEIEGIWDRSMKRHPATIARSTYYSNVQFMFKTKEAETLFRLIWLQ